MTRMQVYLLLAMNGLFITHVSLTVLDKAIQIGVVQATYQRTNVSEYTMDSYWVNETELSNKILQYNSYSPTALRKIARDLVDVDIFIGNFPKLILNRFQNVLSWKTSRTDIVDDLDLSDQLWYIRITDSCENTETVLPDNCNNQRTTAKYLANVIFDMKWTHTSVIFDRHNDELAFWLTDLLSQKQIKVNQYRIKSNERSVQFLRSSYHLLSGEWKKYVVLAGKDCLKQLFRELNQFDARGLSPTGMKTFSLWLVWGQDVTSRFLEDKVVNISNVAVVERIGCRADRIETRLGLTQDRLFSPPACDICWVNNSCYGETQRKKNILHLKESIMNSLTIDSKEAGSFKLSTAVFQLDGRRFQTVDLIKRSQQELFPNTNYGLNQMFIRVATLAWPMQVVKTYTSDGRVEFGGLCMELLAELARRLNFTYSLHEPADMEWGRFNEGRWTGLMGEIVYDRADLVVAPLSAQKDRKDVVDFTTAYYTDYNGIIMKMPNIEASRWMLLLQPLRWQVLVAVICVFPLSTFFVWMCEKFSPYYNRFPNRHQYRGLHHINESFWYMLGALFSRCGIHLPRAMSSRFVMGFWWLFIVVLVATYCGNLMAFLAVTRIRKPFETIAEMVAQDDYMWGASNGTYILELVQKSENPEYRKLWEGITKFRESYPWVVSPSHKEQVEKVKLGNYAFLTDAVSVMMNEEGNCDLVRANEKFLRLQLSMTLGKHSAYTSMLSNRVIDFIEKGLLEYWEKKWTPKAAICPAFLQTGARKITMTDIQSSFYILMGGIALSFLICVLEKLYVKREGTKM